MITMGKEDNGISQRHSIGSQIEKRVCANEMHCTALEENTRHSWMAKKGRGGRLGLRNTLTQ